MEFRGQADSEPAPRVRNGRDPEGHRAAGGPHATHSLPEGCVSPLWATAESCGGARVQGVLLRFSR